MRTLPFASVAEPATQSLKKLKVLTTEQCDALIEEAKNLLAKQAAKGELTKVPAPPNQLDPNPKTLNSSQKMLR